MTIAIFFLVLALILTILAAFNTPSPRVNLGWLGMAFLIAYIMMTQGVVG